ncbi:MAG: hypothetical protein Metus_1266 [Candidatus Methanosuratincola subterraneus]|uniref:Methyl-accepting chemotaxis protein n=1 Tax=Methanosuratincola subterraneus TaxID=2593994 RepID=A0A444L6V4_METS7|nr:MAG: hypothetical protein Metus_1266 [Candidatus Methanosuratincola subterraneus]
MMNTRKKGKEDILLEIDKDGIIKSINEAGARIFGYRASDLIGKSIVGTIMASKGKEEDSKLVSKIFAAPNGTISIMENISRTGSPVTVKWVNEAVAGDDGSVFARRCIGTVLAIDSSDELKALQCSFDLMRENLRKVILKIAQSATHVSEYAGTLGSSAEELSSSANQVSQSIQQIGSGAQSQAKSVSEIATMTKDVLDAVSSARALADEVEVASKKALTGATSVSELGRSALESLEKIKADVKNAKSSADVLYESNAKVSEITSTIKDIADQVSLLALNAAIEAARAGEAGKGFAVVAEEIRKLAGETRTSAEKVSDLVGDVTAKTKQASSAIISVAENVEKGSLAISNALEKIPAISDVAKDVESKASAVKTKLASIEESAKTINSNVSNLASASQEMAASSEEISAAAEEQASAVERLATMAQELSNLAVELKEVVSSFKT